jgi:hypothetical protein
MASTLRARPGYGRISPWVHEVGERMVAEGGEDALWLDTAIEQSEKDGAIVSSFSVAATATASGSGSYPHRPEPLCASLRQDPPVAVLPEQPAELPGGEVLLCASIMARSARSSAAIRSSCSRAISGVRRSPGSWTRSAFSRRASL